ncbi:D-methionine transport system ATP-binding protein [Salinibacterium amurskyense]|uniref:D-methionine transport system ATP-binding protein n=1 Tax=Salinibacterium amurskyense TaxID=205941 RepID=A0A2M9D8T6_9MICO|nr:ATP-binding cassette domain-containing protein [Salinibacterium amurskyense]PJJ82129.1 D-methionine transport system ATP-binding protein [Salinibacterium amurskyense]RLQ81906.1 ATP-binding cassette domain-containing protein [Salinibacterium amurskyense]GHD78062.1 methionine import ATP-binding protein MetN [Salinibacterium amurskyense]
MITLNSVTKTFGDAANPVRALDDVSLSVASGEIFGVIGQSGAGKSTLIRTVNLLERPDAGTVTVGDRELTALNDRELLQARREIGMVFQQFNLLDSRTVRGNVELALEVVGVDRRERTKRTNEILELVGLEHKAQQYPAQLSGGQKQRVGIARALASRPRVLLSDEATSALDPETTESILQLLRSINKELGLTILLITHEMDVVKSICDSAALMSGGRILEQGRLVDLLSQPGSQLARGLFPLGELPEGNSTVIDVTFVGLSSGRPVVSQLARTHQIDVGLVGAAIETIAGAQSGRTRLELPGTADANAAAINDLRAQGLVVEIVRSGR